MEGCLTVCNLLPPLPLHCHNWSVFSETGDPAVRACSICSGPQMQALVTVTGKTIYCKTASYSAETETFCFSVDVLTSCGWLIYEQQYFNNILNNTYCITFAVSTRASLTESLWMKANEAFTTTKAHFQPASTVYCLNLNSSKMIHD